MQLKTDLNAWRRMVESQKKRIKSTATEYVQKKTLQVYKFVLERTPQYTSDLVTSWGIEVGVGATPLGYTAHPDKGKPNAQFMPAAFMNEGVDPVSTQSQYDQNWKRMYELGKARAKFIKYNNRITLVNYAPTADILQNSARDPATFRPVTYQLVKDSSSVLVNDLWNIRSVTLMKFQYLTR